MSEPIIHLIIPLLILLVICDKDKHMLIFALSPIAIIPDIDILYDHRGLLHNIFIPIGILVFSKFLSEKWKPTLTIISVYFISHIILDVFNGGVGILYPLYNMLFVVKTEILLTKDTHILYNVFDWGFENGYTDPEPGIHVIGTEGIGILILSLTLLFSKKYLYKMV